MTELQVHFRRTDQRDHAVLIEAVAAFAGVDPADVQLRRRCARCGSTSHGKPEVVSPRSADGGQLHASLSRTPGFAAAVVTDVAPIGLDIERVDRVARAPIDLHPTEQAALAELADADQPRRLTLLWTVKEAALKATGDGLNVDPASLAIELGDDERPTLSDGPDGLLRVGSPTITTFDPEPGVLAAIVLLGRHPAPTVRVIR
ncbi:4'-phosphopantetheinyl transferase superfamily protein [Diaminobutyricimonas sp. TR449]|uniref:4'-phosphopantetheinyl transferase family protein n=1 Tax=Diaminobutyricimonas sp. TR449 TaxID=2708076 RepID=UPI001421219A|nr:4'-phosphopantetheinyl transferase superfamily protein [Diaminobutyricimonas sp. TR449]